MSTTSAGATATAPTATPPYAPPTTGRHHDVSLRNRGPISTEIMRALGGVDFAGDWLEIGSGTGALVETLAQRMPKVRVQPTEFVAKSAAERTFAAHGKLGAQNEEELSAIDEVAERVGAQNRVAPARHLDLLDAPDKWDLPLKSYDAMHVGNVLHLVAAPTGMTNLAAGAQLYLRLGGILTVYGPFKRDGTFSTPSNADFDAKLRATNPLFGLRNDIDLINIANAHGLVHVATVDMPANIVFMVFRKLMARA